MKKQFEKQTIADNQTGDNPIPIASYREIHAIVKKRFEANPSKSYQWHLLEVWAAYQNQ